MIPEECAYQPENTENSLSIPSLCAASISGDVWAMGTISVWRKYSMCMYLHNLQTKVHRSQDDKRETKTNFRTESDY